MSCEAFLRCRTDLRAHWAVAVPRAAVSVSVAGLTIANLVGVVAADAAGASAAGFDALASRGARCAVRSSRPSRAHSAAAVVRRALRVGIASRAIGLRTDRRGADSVAADVARAVSVDAARAADCHAAGAETVKAIAGRALTAGIAAVASNITSAADQTHPVATLAVDALGTGGTSITNAMIRRRCLRVAARSSKTRDSRNQQRSRTGHRNALEQLAAIDIDHRRSAVVAEIEQICLAQLIDGERKKSRLRSKIESRNYLRADLVGRMTAFLEKLEHASSRRIEKMDTIELRVIDQHLLVERVLEKTRSYTREFHYATGK